MEYYTFQFIESQPIYELYSLAHSKEVSYLTEQYRKPGFPKRELLKGAIHQPAFSSPINNEIDKFTVIWFNQQTNVFIVQEY